MCVCVCAWCTGFGQIYLEYVGEVTQVEDVVELDGGGEEGGGDTLVEGQGELHQLRGALLQRRAEALPAQVLAQDAGVDGVEGVCAREAQGKHRKVSLPPERERERERRENGKEKERGRGKETEKRRGKREIRSERCRGGEGKGVKCEVWERERERDVRGQEHKHTNTNKTKRAAGSLKTREGRQGRRGSRSTPPVTQTRPLPCMQTT